MRYPGRFTRLLLGAFSLAPLAAVVYMLTMAFFPAVIGAAAYTAEESDRAFSRFLAACALLMLCSVALTIYFLVIVFRSPRIRPELKAVWAIVLLMGNAVAFPVFWYLYLWRDAATQVKAEASPVG